LITQLNVRLRILHKASYLRSALPDDAPARAVGHHQRHLRLSHAIDPLAVRHQLRDDQVQHLQYRAQIPAHDHHAIIRPRKHLAIPRQLNARPRERLKLVDRRPSLPDHAPRRARRDQKLERERSIVDRRRALPAVVARVTARVVRVARRVPIVAARDAATPSRSAVV